MRKKFKVKKKFNYKLIIYVFLVVFFIIMVKCYNIKIKIIKSNELLINSILGTTNYYSYNDYKKHNTINKIYEYIHNDIFNNPLNLLKNQMNYDTKEEIVLANNPNFTYNQNELPKVYLYNSHQGENYKYEYLDTYNIIPNITMISDMLEEKLENINISTIVEKNDILKYMKEHNYDHSESYLASRYFLEKIINKYNSIDLYIDLHRDAAPKNVTYTEINNKPCAKVLFVIGLEYPTYKENLKIATNINNIILKKYPSLTRGIMKKEGYGVNGVYNQDLKNNIILMEIGGNENNIDEVNNTLDLIADVIGEYLNEK